MALNIVAIIISGVAALTSIAALIVSICHKRSEHRHIFYSKLEERFSSVLFESFPNALSSFINERERKIFVDKYNALDDCFSELYSSIKCLDYLSDDEYSEIQQSISDLEDSLMYLKNYGYNDDKLKSANQKNKKMYSAFRKFGLRH